MEPAPGVTTIWLAVPVSEATEAAAPVDPITIWPLVRGPRLEIRPPESLTSKAWPVPARIFERVIAAEPLMSASTITPEAMLVAMPVEVMSPVNEPVKVAAVPETLPVTSPVTLPVTVPARPAEARI